MSFSIKSNIRLGIQHIRDNPTPYKLGYGRQGTVYKIPQTNLVLKVLTDKPLPQSNDPIVIFTNRLTQQLLKQFPNQLGSKIGTVGESELLNKLDLGVFCGDNYKREQEQITQPTYLRNFDSNIRALTTYMIKIAQDDHATQTLNNLESGQYSNLFKETKGQGMDDVSDLVNYQDSLNTFVKYFNKLGSSYINELHRISNIQQKHFNDALEIMHQLAKQKIETDHTHNRNFAYNEKYGFQFFDFQYDSPKSITQLFKKSFDGFQRVLLGYRSMGMEHNMGSLVSIDPEFKKQSYTSIQTLIQKLKQACNTSLSLDYKPDALYDYLGWKQQ